MSSWPAFQLGFYSSYNTVFGAPVLDPDGTTLYFASVDHSVYALDLSTGRKLWQFRTQGPVYSSPVLTADGMLLVGSSDGILYCLESDDGTPIWDFAANFSFSNSPVVVNSTTILLSTDAVNTEAFRAPLAARARLENARHLFALDLNGRLLWKRCLDDMVAPLAIRPRDGMVYIPGADTTLLAVRGTNGRPGAQVVWRFRAGPKRDRTFGGANLYRPPVFSADGNTLFFGSYDSCLYAVDANTGALRWRRELPHWVAESPVVGRDGTVYATSADMHLRAFDPVDGTVRWNASTGPHLPTAPVIGLTNLTATGTAVGTGVQDDRQPQEVIYVGTREALNDNLFAFTTGGELLWSAATGGDYGIGVTAVVADRNRTDIV